MPPRSHTEYLSREEERDFSLSVACVGRPPRPIRENPDVKIKVIKYHLYQDILRLSPESAKSIRNKWPDMTVAELEEVLLSCQ